MSDLMLSLDAFSVHNIVGGGTNLRNEIVDNKCVKIEPENNQFGEIEKKMKCGEIFALFSGDYILVCNFCGAKFSTMQLLGNHLHQHHSGKFIESHARTENITMLPADEPADQPSDNSSHPSYKAMELFICKDYGIPYKNQRNSVRHRMKTECAPEKTGTEKELIRQSSLRIHCETCGISYKNRRNLVRHQKKTGCKHNSDPLFSVMIHNENSKEIDTGNQTEPSKYDTNERYPKEHTKPAPCETFEIDPYSCDKGKNPALEKALGLESKPYACDICGNQFECEHWLVTHMKNHPTISTKPDFLCVVCGRGFNCKKNLANHQRSHKQCTQYETERPKELIENESTTAHNPDLFCELCNQYYKNKVSLFMHADSHEVIPAVLQSNLEFLKCKYCYKEFSKYADRKLHEATHTGNRPYECPYCRKGFVSNISRKAHFRIHTGESPYQCDRCPKVFRDKYDLRRHIERHLNIRNVACDICDKRFYHKHQLELHMRTHTKERPYICEDCGKTFVVLPQLKDHQLRHKGIKDVKCEVCGRLFYSRSVLKVHMASHSNDKPFECNVCGRRFSRAKAMQKHMKLHSGVKKYVCNICGKAYAQDSGLYAHKKSHTRQF